MMTKVDVIRGVMSFLTNIFPNFKSRTNKFCELEISAFKTIFAVNECHITICEIYLQTSLIKS